ncbi:acyl-CoA dehydrogenase [Nocardiopsis sediminis]|uniref:Acyl-CoA dehydrogenase n=1 Tax=Nocardiopsis sediminis TaxID=1778267 RepID=A0ABV8FFQ0_9ACTN
MAIGLTAEHDELAAAVRGWVERTVPRDSGQGGTDPDAERAAAAVRPGFWPALARQGLLGLHLPEEHGGQGGGLLELCVALEELGRGLVPGPFLPTVLASAAVQRAHTAGGDRPGGPAARARAALLRDLAEGERTAALALGPPLDVATTADGARSLSGTLTPVLGGALADVLVVPVDDEGAERWAVIDAAGVRVEPLPSLDIGRSVARAEAAGAPLPEGAVLPGLTREDVDALAAVLIGAEATGVAAWCLHAAADYARLREQFGRPIGQFQGVKHMCARMAIAVEQARAVVWDAARAADAAHDGGGAGPGTGSATGTDPGDARFAAAAAGLIAPDAALSCARDCIQVHGGIGFTWEHDAHRYLRRASTLRILAGPGADRAVRVADLALAGRRRPIELDLDDAGDRELRERVRAGVASLAALTDDKERFSAMADGGWVAPHLPPPWGRGAGPLEQLLIQQELHRSGVKGPSLAIGAWVLPSLVGYGSEAQQERFLGPTLRGELTWCQLFSEPGAGSDLASLSLSAERAEGGYRLNGQKIWTSMAHVAHWGICLARTDPDAPDKHDGITYLLVDMAAPGVQVRPLRELTGDTMFNEVFFDDVFVPDACVVGEPGQGWRVARNTLTNERVALSSGTGLGAGVPELVAFCTQFPARAEARDARVEFGRLIAQGQAIELLGLRVTLKQLSGIEPGAESSVRKLLGVEFSQRVADTIWERQGSSAVCEDMRAGNGIWARFMLFGRSMTIYGGTTQVQLNIIAERLLGLPRDPEA